MGSIPIGSAKLLLGMVAQLAERPGEIRKMAVQVRPIPQEACSPTAEAPDLGSGKCGFESRQAH